MKTKIKHCWLFKLRYLAVVIWLVSISCPSKAQLDTIRFDKELSRANELHYTNFDSSQKMTVRLLDLAIEYDDLPRIINARNDLAMGYYSNGQEARALKLVSENLELIDQRKFPFPAKTLLVAGHVTTANNRIEEAREYYRKALNEYLIEDNDEGISYVYSGLGVLEFEQHNYKEALNDYLLSELHWDRDSNYMYTDLLNNIGAVYAQFDDHSSALKYYRRAFNNFSGWNDSSNMALTSFNIADCYLSKGEYDSSLYYFKKSLNISESIESPVDLAWSHFGLYDLYKTQGNFKLALKHFEIYQTIDDSIRASRNLEDALAYKHKYETTLKDKKISEQEWMIDNANLQKEKKQTENLILWISVTLAIAIGIVIFLMYSRIKKVNAELMLQKERVETKNALIDQSLREKEILLKEIHHRVKNNLQIISSLLNLQSHKIEDENAIETLAISRSRIQAIALVHQKLYQSQDMAKVDFKAYIVDLLEQQQMVYSRLSSKLKLCIDIVEVKFNLDSAVPLGLIVSELVTNAFKHGLSQSQNPELTVELSRNGDGFCLQVKDNGPGLPEDFIFGEQESLGMEIIHALVEQIGARIEHSNDHGAIFRIEMKDNVIS